MKKMALSGWGRVAASLATFLALASCSSASSSGGGASYGTGDPALAAANPGGGAIDPFLSDGEAVLHALDAIAAQSGQPFRVISLNADRLNGLTVHVQEPAHHVNVDQYVVAPDGKMTGPTPVKMIAMGAGPVTARDVDLQAFDPSKIGLSRLTATARAAIAKSHFSDARVTEWEFDGVTPDDRRFMYLEAARGRPNASLDSGFRIVKIQF
jgi:hypothetical protein